MKSSAIFALAAALFAGTASARGLVVTYIVAGVTQSWDCDIIYRDTAHTPYGLTLACTAPPTTTPSDFIFVDYGDIQTSAWTWLATTPPGSGLSWMSGSGHCTGDDTGADTISLTCDYPPPE